MVAQLAAPQQAQIDRDLDHAVREWNRLPDVATAFSSWDEDAVLEYVFEWTLEEDRVRRLSAHAERDELTPAQRERYSRLLELVARHRPIVDRLIEA